MKQAGLAFIGIILMGILLVVSGSFYTVSERDQVIITQFGKPIGEPITEAGLRFKIPFIQDVNRLEKRILEWDGRPNKMPTKDKLYIFVDTFARWQISNAANFFVLLRDERSAQSRLDDILGSETRSAVAKHNLIEIIRTTKDRTPTTVEAIAEFDRVGELQPISKGRGVIEKEIFENAKSKLEEYGVELLDIRFKRINYNQDVRVSIYERMISERNQIAELFRSEGGAEASRIVGNKEREVKKIQSEAYKTIQKIEGDADAKATEIYANAYNASPAAAEFYEFLKTMETYKSVLSKDTTVLLSTESDLFQFLKGMDGGGSPKANSSSLPSFP